MKNRQPRKPRNPMARALYENKLFSPQVTPLKKGKGVIYKRTKDWKKIPVLLRFWLTFRQKMVF